MNTETQQAILAEVMAEIERRPKSHFELVYVDYRDKFDQEQVDALARGDWEKLDESVDEWVSEAQHEGAKALLEDIVSGLEDEWDQSVLEDWKYEPAGYEAYEAILEKDCSTPLEDLARNSGNVLLRVKCLDEEDWSEFDHPERELLERLGLPITSTNLAEATQAIDNAAVEYQSLMGYWLLAVQVSTLWDIQTQPLPKLRVTDPGFWLANPWNGSGFDAKFEGVVYIDRADLRTDHDAFGYSWTEVASPVISYYEAEIEAVEEVNA